nr:TPA_asm: hypothetical protein HUJ06_005061 [Nelumbo nucifera]
MGSTSNGVTPMGYRFFLTKSEFVCHYLQNKVVEKRLSLDVVVEVDVYDIEPQFLPCTDGGGEEIKEHYYFTYRSKKSENGSWPNRVVKNPREGGGFWKEPRQMRKSTRMERWWDR